MRLGFGVGLTSRGTRSSLSLLLAGVSPAAIARRWADADIWNDNLTWSDAL